MLYVPSILSSIKCTLWSGFVIDINNHWTGCDSNLSTSQRAGPIYVVITYNIVSLLERIEYCNSKIELEHYDCNIKCDLLSSY